MFSGRKTSHLRRCLRLMNVVRRQFQLESDNAHNANGETNKFYDVVVAGGGMVGIGMACALGTSPRFADKRVLLLDAKPLKSGHELTSTYSNRVSALSPKSKAFMEGVGIWDDVCTMRIKPVKRMHVWDACSDAAVTFSSSDCDNVVDDDSVFYVVENNITIAAFLKRLSELTGKKRVDVQDGVRVNNYEVPTKHDEGFVKVHLNNGEVIETALLIGSDGANSMVRKATDIQNIGWNYNQMSMVATLHFSPENTDNDTAWQRFLPTSTIALLPLTNTLSSLVWTADVSLAKRLMSMTEEDFISELNSALLSDAYTNRNLASVTQSLTKIMHGLMQSNTPARQLPPKVTGMDANSRSVFMIRMGHATQYVAPRVALIGDAIHQVHPHAGQGANLGFGDVQCLRATLDEAISCGSDIGTLTHLLHYERDRQREVVPIIAAIDLLHRQFATDWSPMVALRGFGLAAVNSCQPLKRLLTDNVN